MCVEYRLQAEAILREEGGVMTVSAIAADHPSVLPVRVQPDPVRKCCGKELQPLPGFGIAVGQCFNCHAIYGLSATEERYFKDA